MVYNNGLTSDNSKPLAVPYDDKITNLEKYAFGLNATKSTSYAANPLFTYSNNGTIVRCQYPVNSKADDINVKAYASEDMVNWTEVSPIANGTTGAFDLFKIEQSVPTGGKLFFKLEVNQ